MSPVVESMHEQYARGRRAHALANHFTRLIPANCSVLDVGTGDGTIAAVVQARRPDLRIEGLEYQVRDDCAIPVEQFDGKKIPCADGSYDYVSFLDVLHHTVDPMVLLSEATRVARRGLIIKDHLLQGILAGPTLRFMDSVGNRRFGIELPNTYWRPEQWQSAWKVLELEERQREENLGIYPFWANWVFGRGLHFFVRVEKQGTENGQSSLEYWDPGLSCCNARWEAAYNRFETPGEERDKFRKRFRAVGIDQLPRSTRIVDIFCGRGNGLRVLQEWGFQDLTGVDLSPELLVRCPASIRRIVADCRELKFTPGSVEVFIVQGGLHHLPHIPGDLERCLDAVHEALVPGGRFYVIEPWDTRFLRCIHRITRNPLSRRLIARFDAFATMVEEEQETYDQWLSNGAAIRTAFRDRFILEQEHTGMGKCRFIARKNQA